MGIGIAKYMPAMSTVVSALEEGERLLAGWCVADNGVRV